MVDDHGPILYGLCFGGIIYWMTDRIMLPEFSKHSLSFYLLVVLLVGLFLCYMDVKRGAKHAEKKK